MNLEDQSQVMPVESALWLSSGQTPPGAVPQSAAPMAPPAVEYGRCDEHQIRNCLACGIKTRNAAKAALTAAQELRTAQAPSLDIQCQPAPAPPQKPTIDQDSPAGRLLLAAQALAQAIAACDRLNRKIEGLDLSLVNAKTELASANVAKTTAQDTLRNTRRLRRNNDRS